MRNAFLTSIFLIIILNTVFGQGYWDFVQDESQHKILKSAKIEIEVAVFDALFNENASMIQENASYYYVSIKDSTNKTLPQVLKAFDNNNPQVKSLEDYNNLSSEEQKTVKFLSFYIGQIKVGKRKAVVSCGYYEGNLSSSINHVLLIKKRGKWKVIENKIVVIS